MNDVNCGANGCSFYLSYYSFMVSLMKKNILMHGMVFGLCGVVFVACTPTRPDATDARKIPVNKYAPNPDTLPRARQAKQLEDAQRELEAEQAAAAVLAPKSVPAPAAPKDITDIEPQEANVTKASAAVKD
jgi:hypothetical protein